MNESNEDFKADQDKDVTGLQPYRSVALDGAGTVQSLSSSISTLASVFLLASVLGWLFEIVLYLLNDGMLINPGMLHGPWTPIYGVTGILILVLFKGQKSKPIVLFFRIALLAGMIELATGFFLDMILGVRWWDYSESIFNIGGYVCLEALLAFGLLGMFLMYILAPACEKLLLSAPRKVVGVILGVVLFAFALDVIYSLGVPNYEATQYNNAAAAISYD